MRMRVGFVAGFVPLVLLWGCPTEEPPPGVDAGPPPQCAVDLLYNAATAQSIALASAVDGFLCPAGDQDWYRFNVAAAGSIVKVHLWMDTHLTPIEPMYSLFDGDGTAIGVTARHPDRSQGEAVDFEGAHRIEEPGDYIVVVQDAEGFDDRLDIDKPYHVSVEVTPDPDENEVNNTAEDATPLVAGTPMTGLIGTTGDEDWFALPVEQDARIIDLTARAPSAMGVDLVVEVLLPDAMTRAGGGRLLDDGTELSTRMRFGAAGSAGTVYYVRVYDESGDKAQLDETLGTYEIVAELSADPDAQETGGRNDTFATATTVSAASVSYTGSLSAMNDVDLFKVTPPAGTSRNNPGVLVVELTLSGASAVQPQILVYGHDPEEADAQLDPCPCEQEIDPDNPLPSEPPQFCLQRGSGGNACGEVRFQKVMTPTTLSGRAGYPLRNTRPVFVSINHFQVDDPDGYQEDGQSYTLELSVVDDPDPGERGDDYLIPNLEFPTYDNSEELWAQGYESRPRARDISVPFLPLCSDVGGTPDGGAAPACMEEAAVPNPGNDGQVGTYVVCDGQDWTVQGSGRISYQGDRDWFRVEMPEAGYWALDFTYDVSATTPVEVTYFTHADGNLIAAWLEAEQTGGGCNDSADCPAGDTCIDYKCWGDIDANPAFNDHVFPSSEQCAYLHVNDGRPLYIEVADNGINDFDLDMAYNFHLRIRCGCPTNCNGGYNSCQGVAPPAP